MTVHSPIPSMPSPGIARAGDPAPELPPTLPGIDLAQGLAYAARKPAFYLRMLRRFRDAYGGSFDADYRAALNSADPKAAPRLAHTLKGLAASIGASELSARAARLERTWRDERPADREPAEAALREELLRVLAGLASLGDPAPTPATAPAATEAQP